MSGSRRQGPRITEQFSSSAKVGFDIKGGRAWLESVALVGGFGAFMEPAGPIVLQTNIQDRNVSACTFEVVRGERDDTLADDGEVFNVAATLTVTPS